MGKSINALKEEVVLTLGGSISDSGAIVQVELTDEQYDVAVDQTKRWFSAKKGYTIFRPITYDANTTVYPQDDDVVNVLDVIFQIPDDVAAFFSLGFFDVIPYGPQNVGQIGAGLTNYSGFAQLLEFNEKRKRVFSVEPDWFYEQQTRILHITRRAGGVSGTILVQAKLNTFDVQDLGGRDEELFARYLHAKCHTIVGRIRSKYDSMPAAGGTITLDGKTLLEEAKAEIELLEKEIYASQGPDGFIAG